MILEEHYHAFGEIVTARNASEPRAEDGFYLRILIQKDQHLCESFRRGSAAGIHEVGRLTAEIVDEIVAHDAEPCTAREHANIAVEIEVRERAPSEFPILHLVVAGGHTVLILQSRHLQWTIVGRSLAKRTGPDQLHPRPAGNAGADYRSPYPQRNNILNGLLFHIRDRRQK